MTAIFSLPAGHSCPFAKECFSKADRKTGRITDGPDTVFRCYAASLETRPAVRAAHWHNFDLLKSKKTIGELTDFLSKQIPEALRYRVHSSGDFYSLAYFDAWMNVARMFPQTIFYAYTKALPFWVLRKDSIPANFRLVASYGGTHDHLIPAHGLRYSKVVKSESEAKKLGLNVDKDDSIAYGTNDSFALVVHGTQPKGTVWAKAWYKIKKAKSLLKKGEK